MNKPKAKAIVTLYTRGGCHLCEEAKQVILPVIWEFEAEMREVDIDADDELRTRYDKQVPLIFVGESLFARYRVDQADFRRALAKIAPSRVEEV